MTRNLFPADHHAIYRYCRFPEVKEAKDFQKNVYTCLNLKYGKQRGEPMVVDIAGEVKQYDILNAHVVGHTLPLLLGEMKELAWRIMMQMGTVDQQTPARDTQHQNPAHAQAHHQRTAHGQAVHHGRSAPSLVSSTPLLSAAATSLRVSLTFCFAVRLCYSLQGFRPGSSDARLLHAAVAHEQRAGPVHDRAASLPRAPSARRPHH
jgi:hypothetical protein